MKTRKLVGGWILLLAAVSVYAYIDLTYTIRMNEAVNVWFGILFQGTSVSALLMYLLPLAGISLAIVQFVPEMTQKRFKLTLHLPASETRLVSSMLLFGYGVLGVLYLSCLVFLSLLVSRVLPFEGVSMMLSHGGRIAVCLLCVGVSRSLCWFRLGHGSAGGCVVCVPFLFLHPVQARRSVSRFYRSL